MHKNTSEACVQITTLTGLFKCYWTLLNLIMAIHLRKQLIAKCVILLLLLAVSDHFLKVHHAFNGSNKEKEFQFVTQRQSSGKAEEFSLETMNSQGISKVKVSEKVKVPNAGDSNAHDDSEEMSLEAFDSDNKLEVLSIVKSQVARTQDKMENKISVDKIEGYHGAAVQDKVKDRTPMDNAAERHSAETKTQTATLPYSKSGVNHELIEALQHHLFGILKSVLQGYSSVILTEVQYHENKGDSAITVGELNTLYFLNKTLKHSFVAFRDKWIYNKTKTLINPNKTVILAQGGGNIGAWPGFDRARATVLDIFTNFKYVVLPQSVHFFMDHDLKFANKTYNRKDLTMILRDKASYNFTKTHFKQLKSILAPDMAFGIGYKNRFSPPTVDIVWINRGDKERSRTYRPVFPTNISYVITDWMDWLTPRSRHDIEGCYLKTYNGFVFLQRAKVVVTDRLHGFIMALLLDIPVVILDNRIKKLSHFHETWTHDAHNVLVASTVEDAVQKALGLLQHSASKAPGFG